MADSRFFKNHGPFTQSRLAEITGGELAGTARPEAEMRDVAALSDAGADDVSFLDNRRYLAQFEASAAGLCLVDEATAKRAPAGMALLVCAKPYRAYAQVARAFYPTEGAAVAVADIHSSAEIDASAKFGAGVGLGPGVVVGPDVVLGDWVRVGANTVLESGVRVGGATQVGANTTLSHCDIGERCVIHPGVRIGQRGFGFDMDPQGHLDVPQLGRVKVGDDVEIGANSTIDRGAGPDTIIGDGCKIDNLVQIGHNVRLGRGCVIVAQAGISGSAHLEDMVVLAGQSGVAGHITLGAGTQIAAQSGAMRDTPPMARMAGSPALPARKFFKQVALLDKLAGEDKSGKK